MAAARFALFLVVLAVVAYLLYRLGKWGVYYVSERMRLAQKEAKLKAEKDIKERESDLDAAYEQDGKE